MTLFLTFALDLVAISVLTFALYFPRHRRRELVVAYLGVNVGVLVVATALSSSTIGAGLGLGLFGVLSIIRLRSTELGQQEVAYYFASLAIGLLAGLSVTPLWLTAVLAALVMLTLFVGDHPRMFARYRSQIMVLDSAFTDETALVAHLEQLLGATVHAVVVQRVDLVVETTLVDVRYQLDEGGRGPRTRAHGRVDEVAAAPQTASGVFVAGAQR